MVKKEARINFKGSLVIGIISLILGLGFVYAVHIVTTSSGGTSFNFNQSVSYLYNITINNTDPGQTANITQVNITFSSSIFLFSAGTNGTNTPFVTFTNTSTVLSWTNSTGYLINGSTNNSYFWFNATASTPGRYNITVTTLNSTGPYTTNLSVTINDTTAPNYTAFVSPGLNTSLVNLSQNSIPINISATDNGVISSILIRLYNSTRNQINSSTNSSTPSSWFFNFTGLSDGIYYVNATVNDTYNNVNNTATLTITLDNVAPSITYSCSPTTFTSLGTFTCSCPATDATSGVQTTTYTASYNIASYSAFTTGGCTSTDYASNSATTSGITYAYTAGSSVSGGSIVSKWVKQIKLSDSELNLGQTLKILKKNYRLTFNVKGLGHQVGITSMTDKTVTIEVASTPQIATLAIGDLKKFDVDADGYYDISVKLNSITGTDAGLVIASINEKVTEVAPPTTEKTTGEKITEGVKNIASGKNSTLWIVIVVIVVLVLIGVAYKYKKK